jgi:hemerythrin-like domain-containing protein
MSKAIDQLRHDHDAILSALKILDKIAAEIDKGSKPGKADLASFIGFLKEFADTCHHGKEEGILFPALAKAGIPEKGGPIGVMLSEHVQGRDSIKTMESSLSPSVDYKSFAAAAKEYIAMLRSHIDKENNVLFPMAEQVLDGPRLEGLAVSFDEHEEKVIGHGRHEELHQMLKDLKARYFP